LKSYNKYLPLLTFLLSHPRLAHLILQVRQQHLTYLSITALSELAEAVLRVESLMPSGLLIECGSALGGSALVMAGAKFKNRALNLYDTFEMIPPPSENDEEDAWQRFRIIQGGQATGVNGGIYYGYVPDLYQRVQQTFLNFGFSDRSNRIRFIRGLFEKTLIIDQPVALAHLDCDWYESVMTCLSSIEPHLLVGGILVIDDYYDWAGCRKAVDEYFANSQDKYRFIHRNRLQILKIQ